MCLVVFWCCAVRRASVLCPPHCYHHYSIPMKYCETRMLATFAQVCSIILLIGTLVTYQPPTLYSRRFRSVGKRPGRIQIRILSSQRHGRRSTETTTHPHSNFVHGCVLYIASTTQHVNIGPIFPRSAQRPTPPPRELAFMSAAIHPLAYVCECVTQTSSTFDQWSNRFY